MKLLSAPQVQLAALWASGGCIPSKKQHMKQLITQDTFNVVNAYAISLKSCHDVVEAFL